jgi:hypothetical protein
MTEPSLSLEPVNAFLPVPLRDLTEWPPTTLTLIDVVHTLLHQCQGLASVGTAALEHRSFAMSAVDELLVAGLIQTTELLRDQIGLAAHLGDLLGAHALQERTPLQAAPAPPDDPPRPRRRDTHEGV